MGSHNTLRLAPVSAATLARQNDSFQRSLIGNLKALDTIVPPVAYPKGAILFMEGQPSRGIFAVCSGLVKLCTTSLQGKKIILKIAEAGELLGLPATLAGRPYEVSAEVAESSFVNFIPRTAFLRYLHGHPEAMVQMAQHLTESHFSGHEVLRCLALSRSAAEKLARFFLNWSADHAHGQDHLLVMLTHAEIGEAIGASRETVSRTLTTFKNKNLLTVNGIAVEIRDRAGLQQLADG